MKKKTKILIGVLVPVVILAPLVGLLVTGYQIGWGPFSSLQWYNSNCYTFSDQKSDYKIIDKEIKGKNGTIRGKLYYVEKKEKQPLVVFSHGLNTTMITLHTTCQSLASSGISVFSFDYCGGATNSSSDMSSKDMSILTERQDLNDVLDEAKTWDEFDSSKISVAGYSQGGLVAAITAKERDDIYRLNLVYPAFMMYDEIRMRYPTVDLIPDEQNNCNSPAARRRWRGRYPGRAGSWDHPASPRSPGEAGDPDP